MKQGLSLRVSQHLALTPQLQQSIRLLQLSTLELAQEVEQMLGDNPFLEMSQDEAAREEFGLDRADTPAPQDEREAEFTPANDFTGSEGERTVATSAEADTAPVDTEPSDWEGDGSTELVPDDGEWGGEAQARRANNEPGDDVEAADLARPHESLQEHLHRQALALRLAEEDRAALRFLIE
jgi:RNA polymerase sigma-54 factor